MLHSGSMLISIRSMNPDLQVEYRTAIQSALQQFSDIEKTVERSLVQQATSESGKAQ